MANERIKAEVRILKAYVDAVINGDLETLSLSSVDAFVRNIEEAIKEEDISNESS